MTYIGRIAREKNLGLLLEAWETLAPERGSAKLVLVGRGPLEDEIRRREIPGVHVSGLMHGPELSAAYASADIFAFPSATETFGNSLLEAMGSGLPSLVAAAGGVLEFAQHGRNAWLVAPNSAAAIADGLRRLLHDAGAPPPPGGRRAADRPGAGLGRGVRSAAGGLSRTAIDAEGQPTQAA